MTDPDVYTGLEPAELWRHFAALNAIPRPSGKEAVAAAYVRQVAETAGAAWEADARGNTVVSRWNDAYTIVSTGSPTATPR